MYTDNTTIRSISYSVSRENTTSLLNTSVNTDNTTGSNFIGILMR